MTKADAYHIKLASFDEIKLMLSWADNENWNTGLHDAFAFQLIDPYGFFIGYLGDKPISCISTVKYQQDYAHLGLYIVSPNYRGQGYGTQIWQHSIQYAKSAGSIGLDGVIAQQQLYNKLGFHLTHRNLRYELSKNIFQDYTHQYLIPVNTLPLTEIFEYDRKCFPANRDAFLTAWVLLPNAKTLSYYVDHQIKGYGVIRECQKGYKIGPLFADTDEIARILFQGLCASIPIEKINLPIFLDIPEPNNQAKKMVASYAMTLVFETARMYAGPIPAVLLDSIFGITTFEMG